MMGEMPGTKNEATVALQNLPDPYGTPCRVSIDSSKVPYNLMWIICVQSNKKLFLQASEELEDRQSLAVMAASGQDEVTGPDGETFIEKYTRGK